MIYLLLLIHDKKYFLQQSQFSHIEKELRDFQLKKAKNN